MAIRELKVCLLGDTGVGKSSIVCRFVQDHFDHNISPTIGASFMTKTVPCGNELHKFLIWDTAGQERRPGSVVRKVVQCHGLLQKAEETVTLGIPVSSSYQALRCLPPAFSGVVRISAGPWHLRRSAVHAAADSQLRLALTRDGAASANLAPEPSAVGFFGNLVHFPPLRYWTAELRCARITLPLCSFHSLAPMYYRGSAAAVIVYDITKQDSFHTLKKWVKELKEHGPENIVMAIAGNKCDLSDIREVPLKDAKDYAESIGAVVVETSAKHAINIEELFQGISRQIPPLDPLEKGNNGAICMHGGKPPAQARRCC
ncbi:Ras-related protein Rab-31 [Heterocephalus glaber]|uniref:Ras-related protein Rab-31 n=1 Tax=Heterocephalus glaber TaxID=10181 RepID=G5C064_HETGA|nr:Ras-related protein Rab-31 [Heterocephalus glaber]